MTIRRRGRRVKQPHFYATLWRKLQRIPPLAALFFAVWVVFLGAVYFKLDLVAGWQQRLLGLVCAGLATAVFVFATREREIADELFQRMRQGRHLDFGKKLREERRQRRMVKLPVVGEIPVRNALAVAIFLVVDLWWWTPLAPVGIKERELGDLLSPITQEILSVVLVSPDGKLITLQPPVPPPELHALAKHVPEDADMYLLGLKAIADQRYSQARVLLGAALKTDDAPRQDILVARAHAELLDFQFAEAVSWYQRALQRESNHPTLLGLTAVAWLREGNCRTANPLVARMVQIARTGGKEARTSLATGLHILAATHVASGREYDTAERLNKEAQDLWQNTVGDDDPRLAATYNNQAIVYQLRYRLPGARLQFNWAADVWRRAYGQRDAHVAAALGNLAMLEGMEGRLAEAEQLNEKALVMSRDVLWPGHPAIGVELGGTAAVELAAGHYDEARRLAEDALAGLTKALGSRSPPGVALLNLNARIYTAQGYYNQAEGYYIQCATMAKEVLGSEHPYLIDILLNTAELDALKGRFDLAEQNCAEALGIAQKAFGKRNPVVASCLEVQGKLLAMQNRAPEARLAIEKALEMGQELFGKEHFLVARTLALLATVEDGSRTRAKTISDHEQVIKLYETFLGESHPEVARLVFNLARFHLRQGQEAEASPMVERVLAIREETLLPFHPDLAATLEAKAAVLRKTDPEGKEADAILEQARQIRERHAEEDRVK